MFEVDNELLKMLRDGNWREYEVAWSICSSRWGIGWVVFGRNELCDDARDRAGAVSQEGVFERATSRMVQRQQRSVGEPSEREHYSLYC